MPSASSEAFLIILAAAMCSILCIFSVFVVLVSKLKTTFIKSHSNRTINHTTCRCSTAARSAKISHT